MVANWERKDREQLALLESPEFLYHPRPGDRQGSGQRSLDMSEPRRRSRWRTILLIGLAVLFLAGGGALSQRVALQSWYFAYRLERATESDRQSWADKLIGMDEAAVPRLLGFFRKDDPALCTLAQNCLEKKLAEWGPKDERSARTS